MQRLAPVRPERWACLVKIGREVEKGLGSLEEAFNRLPVPNDSAGLGKFRSSANIVQ